MLIRRRCRADLRADEVTPESVYLDRRRLLLGSLAAGFAPAAAAGGPGPALRPGERLNRWDEITGYNNYYEYSPDKLAVATLAAGLRLRPWALSLSGELARPRTLDIDQLLREFRPQECIRRLRCVEGWSMVIPWDGIPLSAVLARAEPTAAARHVQFVALHDPQQMIGQRRETLAWPYVEALTIDEAMHPLTLLASGVYGRPLAPQNGAPLRLVVPWKYGYKSIKALVAIRVQAEPAHSSWALAAPGDYGVEGNVDPSQPLARGTQSRETRIGELRKRETLPYNGYADEVAHLYARRG